MAEIDKRITAAIKFMRRVSENDSENRKNAVFWRKFRDGEQWPAEIQNSRTLETRPCLTINKVDPYCQKVENQQRQQRPRIKVDPTGGQATKKNADVIKGMIRHIESVKGGADMAYDTGFSSAITEGVGYWRVMSEYTRPDSFEQELYLMSIDDALSVYYDDHAIMPDGSDAEEVLIVSDMAKAAFKSEFPDADDGANFIPQDMGGWTAADWVTKDTIRVAEYFTIKHDRQTLCKLSNGKTAWKDQLLPSTPKQGDPGAAEHVANGGFVITGERMSARKTVQWCKMTAIEVLDERDLPGKYIPVFPCYGRRRVIDGKRRRAGLIKNAVDPQKMSNFWKTAMTESVALAAKAKWLLAEGQDEGHEMEWATANISARSTLRYKPTDIEGKPVSPPIRIQPEPPPEGAMAMAAAIDNDLSTVLGIVEPAMRIRGNVSGKALQSERLQSDEHTFDFYDGMTRAIAFTGRYLVDVMKFYYSEPGRVVRIMGDDGKSKTQAINQPDETDPAKILNDITVGEYDVVMDTGPGYNTKRQEAVDSMMPLFERNEKLMDTAGDVLFRNMDFPGADTIADRLAAANPLSQVDEESETPPAAQMQIKGLQQQLQQAGQMIQGLQLEIKTKGEIEGMREAAASHRLTIAEAAKTKRNDDDNEAWMHDVQTKAMAHISGHEIDAAAKIITQEKQQQHDSRQFERVAAHEDSQLAEQTAKAP